MPFRTNPYVVLAILTALNLLNYIDRSILFQVQGAIQQEFAVSKMQIGLLTSTFTICGIVTLPMLGRMADRYPRRLIIVTGAVVWSVATLLTGLTWDFRSLLIRHAIVGIGEASMIAAPAYIADLFPQEKRGRMLAFLYMTGPSGSAMGYMIAGLLGGLYGWRAPFYVVSGPGVLIALLLLMTREPERGAQDQSSQNVGHASVFDLLRNRAYLVATLGLAMINFAVIGIQVWMPDFLTRERGLNVGVAGTVLGVITVLAGVGASLASGWLADSLRKRRQDAYYLMCAASAALAVPAIVAVIYLPAPAMLPAIFIAKFLLLANGVPLGVAVIESLDARVRSTGIAFHFLVIAIFGGVCSPPLIGRIADRTGSLQTGFLPMVATVGLAAVILLCGRRYAARLPLAKAAAGSQRA